MRIVFMGTPDFAVPSLRKFASGSVHQVVGVVTQPDRPKGRGLRVRCTPITMEASRYGLPLFQPGDLRSDEFLSRLKAWGGDCFVVVGFRILPPEVFEMPPKGTVNLHASLLPKYRGAAPIQWALINGEKKTGVTTFFIQKKVDTGDLILQESVTIGKDETAGELHDRLAAVGADLLVKTLALMEEGRVERIPQKGVPTSAPKITTEHCEIDWNHPAEDIVNQVRGLSPRPGAFTTWKNKRLKIFRAVAEEDSDKRSNQPGRVATVSDQNIGVESSDGLVRIHQLQLEGKRAMPVDLFLRGSDISTGTILGA